MPIKQPTGTSPYKLWQQARQERPDDYEAADKRWHELMVEAGLESDKEFTW